MVHRGMAEIGRASCLAAMLHRVMAAMPHLVMAAIGQQEVEAEEVEGALELSQPGLQKLRENR